MPFTVSIQRRFRSAIERAAADPFDTAAMGLLALLVVLALATFTQYAVSNDEGLQHHYGELIIAYYRSGFTDRSVFDYQNLYLYGGLFDIIAVLLAHLLPFDPYDIRHVMSALAGIGGIAATWATARAIAGPRAGFFASLALALCGVWYGGMFNHTKDIPFAAAMMGTTYYLVRAARDLPQPRWRDVIWFGIWLGAALGLRATGLLMLGYLGLVVLLTALAGSARARSYAQASTNNAVRSLPPRGGGSGWGFSFIAPDPENQSPPPVPPHAKSGIPDFATNSDRSRIDPTSIGEWSTPGLRHASTCFARSFARFLPALATAYLIMIASWPWASLDLLNPVRAIFAFAHFHYPVRTLLDGHVYLMNEVPRWYEPDYLAIKMPMVVLAGALAALAAAAWSARKSSGDAAARGRAAEVALLAFTIVFPLACQVIGHGPSFTGMRHFLFVAPPLAALAGIGVDAGLGVVAGYGRLVAATALLAVLAAFGQDAWALVRLHPYEYLFYNSIVGGLQGAGRRYETDYWVNIMPAAVKELEAHLDELDRQAGRKVPKHYTVGVCGERVSFENEADQRLQWTPDWDHADFFIAPSQMNCDEVLRGRVVDEIDRAGVRIGVVKDLRGLSPQARWAPLEVAHGPTSNTARPAPHG